MHMGGPTQPKKIYYTLGALKCRQWGLHYTHLSWLYFLNIDVIETFFLILYGTSPDEPFGKMSVQDFPHSDGLNYL